MSTVAENAISEFPSFEGVHAWISNSIKKDDRLFKLPPGATNEIIELAQYFDHNPIADEALHPKDFEIPACRIIFDDIRTAVKEGPSFAVVDRLPLDDMNQDAATGLASQLDDRQEIGRKNVDAIKLHTYLWLV